MRETRTSNIGGLDYNVTQSGATSGRRVLTRIAKLIGAAAGSPEPVAAILAALNDEDVGFLCDEFSKMTTVRLDDKRSPYLNSIFEEHFAGKYGEMLKWLGFCIEVNFGSFLAEMGVDAGVLSGQAKAALQSKSPTAQTGRSGA